MIRIERSAAWWTSIAAHPACASALYGIAPEAIGALAENPQMLPLAAEHGGFLLAQMDRLGFVRELHTLFTPEGRGREAARAAVEGLELVFDGPCQVIVTWEIEGRPHARPWRGVGFRRAGDWRETALGSLRMWVLTREAWGASPWKESRKCQRQ